MFGVPKNFNKIFLNRQKLQISMVLQNESDVKFYKMNLMLNVITLMISVDNARLKVVPRIYMHSIFFQVFYIQILI